jgi:CIC family chloride channel protein
MSHRETAITSASSRQIRATTGHLFMVLVAMAVGLCGAIGAVVFRFLIRLVQATAFEGIEGVDRLFDEGFLAEAIDPLAAARNLEWYWRLVLPAFGGLVVGPLIYFFAREAKGHGVPEVMAAVALRGGVIRKRIVAVKALASAISIGSGGSVGREGPIVQIGSALGSALGQFLKVPASQLRVIVACGAAAGISATFNSPIAGALFAAEVIIGNFAVAQLSPIVISSVVATVVSRFFLGNHPAFVVPGYELVSPFELLPYMVVGFVAGFVALAFMLTLYASEDTFDRIPIPEYLKPALGGLIVGGIGVYLPQVFGVGYGTITDALNSALPVTLLFTLLIAKIAATSITLGSGASGGIFAPSLFLGATIGGFMGTLIHQWFPTSTASSGAYALVTMGAVVAAATHAPITAIIIIFELTQTINIIPPLMAACVVSTLVTTFLQRDSIYLPGFRQLPGRGPAGPDERAHGVLRRKSPERAAGLHPPARADANAGRAGRAPGHRRRRGSPRAQPADGQRRR